MVTHSSLVCTRRGNLRDNILECSCASYNGVACVVLSTYRTYLYRYKEMVEEKILKLLSKEAKKSDFIRHRHAACIIHRGKILALGRNRKKSHPLQKKYQVKECQIWLHAEIDAIIRTINKYGVEILKECEINVLRLTKGGKIGNSKPCLGCMKAINTFDIGKVDWTQ